MRKLENRFDDIYVSQVKRDESNSDEVILKMVDTSIRYVRQLIILRPQRAYMLEKYRQTLLDFEAKIELGTFVKDDDYPVILDVLSKVHRTGKEISTQMKQQFGVDPGFDDLETTIKNDEVFSAVKVMNELRWV